MVGDDVPVVTATGASLLLQTFAFLAERLPAGALPQILLFDVVASVAFGVVVMHRLLD